MFKYLGMNYLQINILFPIKIKFNTSMISPALGIYNEQVIIALETEPFPIIGSNYSR